MKLAFNFLFISMQSHAYTCTVTVFHRLGFVILMLICKTPLVRTASAFIDVSLPQDHL